MKKLVLLASAAFIVASMTSCKKDYTCNCTYAGTTYPYTITAKKKDAKDACNSIGSVWISYGGTCSLK